VRVFGVVMTGEPEARAFLEENGRGEWTHLVATEAFIQAYAVSGTPSIIVIDPDGRVAHNAFGSGQLERGLMLSWRLERMVGESHSPLRSSQP
jgi:hypothetical protein